MWCEVEVVVVVIVVCWLCIDVLVNNVGLIGCVGVDIEVVEVEFVWDVVFDVNLKSLFLMMMVVLLYLVEYVVCIVNIGLIVVCVGSLLLGGFVYVVVKVGVEGFIVVLVCEFGLCGVMVNMVVFGYIVDMCFFGDGGVVLVIVVMICE